MNVLGKALESASFLKMIGISSAKLGKSYQKCKKLY